MKIKRQDYMEDLQDAFHEGMLVGASRAYSQLEDLLHAAEFEVHVPADVKQFFEDSEIYRAVRLDFK